MTFNLVWIWLPLESKQAMLSKQYRHLQTGFFILESINLAFVLGMFFFFFSGMVGFKYTTTLKNTLYPESAWFWTNFLFSLVPLFNGTYILSFIKLIYDERKYYN